LYGKVGELEDLQPQIAHISQIFAISNAARSAIRIIRAIRGSIGMIPRPMANPINITTETRCGRLTASSGSKWEPKMGYSRAVRAGNIIAVTGTVGVNADGTYPASMGEQAQRSLDIVVAAVIALGGKAENIIRTRMFVTDVSKWEEVAAVHGKLFSEIRPATSIIEVPRLIDKDAMIEIEADAIIG